MKLNCEAGDLAIIVLSKRCPQYIGRVVRCVSFIGGLRLPGWVIEPHIDQYWCCADRNLRPIRDQPGRDQTLIWADVPSEVTA